MSLQSEFLSLTAALTLCLLVCVGIPVLLSGVWPPYVSVVSGSMEPNVQQGDLVYILDADRAQVGAPPDTAVSTYREGAVETFGTAGNVIVFRPDGQQRTPIIHRARFWVADGENWYEKAAPDGIGVSDCDALRNCPAPHAGYITKGDANTRYDQAAGLSQPVRPAWVVGTAKARLPHLGRVTVAIRSLRETATGETPTDGLCVNRPAVAG